MALLIAFDLLDRQIVDRNGVPDRVLGPWMLGKLARWVVRRRMTTVPWQSPRWES
jgi:hypothetical protein